MGLFGTDSAFGAGLSSIFADLYGDGTFYRWTPGTYDDGGTPIAGAFATGVACKVQRDRATYAMTQAKGYADGDFTVIILRQPPGLPVIPQPTPYDEVTVGGQRCGIGSADLDAVGSHWICRGTKAKASG